MTHILFGIEGGELRNFLIQSPLIVSKVNWVRKNVRAQGIIKLVFERKKLDQIYKMCVCLWSTK